MPINKLGYLTQEQVDQVSVISSDSNSPYVSFANACIQPSSELMGLSCSGTLGASYISRYSNRYLRLPSFLEPDQVEALLTRTKQLLDNFSIEDHPLVVDVIPVVFWFHES